MKAIHMHYGIQYTIKKHGNSQLKVQELIPLSLKKITFVVEIGTFQSVCD
jgi:hypothetical protein